LNYFATEFSSERQERKKKRASYNLKYSFNLPIEFSPNLREKRGNERKEKEEEGGELQFEITQQKKINC
jgi:hypothetical protein